MKKSLLCIWILLVPLLIEASDLHIRYQLRQIAESYADSYLTYQGALKAWYGRTLSRFGIRLDPELEEYVKGRWAFQSSIIAYSITAGSDSLNLDLSPTEFKALFNYEVKRHLGTIGLIKLRLDIHQKYLAPGE
jgi:hypothetical protein